MSESEVGHDYGDTPGRNANYKKPTPQEMGYLLQTCPECGGKGFLRVDDNGTNFGEENCEYCMGEGSLLLNEWGDRYEDREP